MAERITIYKEVDGELGCTYRQAHPGHEVDYYTFQHIAEDHRAELKDDGTTKKRVAEILSKYMK